MAKYKRWMTPEALAQVQIWAEAGLEDDQIAGNMGISASTFYEWQNKFSEFSEAIACGRGGAQVQIENALFQRASGGTVTIKKPMKVKIREYDKQTGRCIAEREEIRPAEEEVYTPPDTNAIKFWLVNRAPDRWGEKIDMTGEGVLRLEDVIGHG